MYLFSTYNLALEMASVYKYCDFMIKGGVTAFGRFNLAYYAAQTDPWPTQASPNVITNNRQNLLLSCKLTYFTD